ncbi:MAG: HEAT repeat domain-containing protein, partial [Syntrophothermus sp.]
MLKKLLCLLILSTSSFAQYTSADLDLAGTTFERKFDKKILEKYISSRLPSNINAALLSMSSAQDTSLIPFILRPDYGKFGSMIAFALGETGPNPVSESFLLEKIISGRYPENQHAAFEALGRCGSQESLNSIVTRYFSNSEFKSDGISVALAGFSARGIKTVDTFEVKVLMKELSNSRNSIKRKAEAAFAASRIGINKSAKNDLLKLLFEKHEDEVGLVLKQYILASLRRMRQGPDSPEQIKSLLTHREWRIRTEAAKLIASLPVKTSETLRLYFTLFTDKNPNVSRQAAISLKDMKIDSSLTFLLKEELKNALLNSTVTPNTAGELFIAYCGFSSEDIFGQIDKLKGRIRPDFIYRALTANNTNPSRNLNYLLTATDPSNKNEKLEHLNAVLSLQKSLPGNSQIVNYL